MRKKSGTMQFEQGKDHIMTFACTSRWTRVFSTSASEQYRNFDGSYYDHEEKQPHFSSGVAIPSLSLSGVIVVSDEGIVGAHFFDKEEQHKWQVFLNDWPNRMKELNALGYSDNLTEWLVLLTQSGNSYTEEYDSVWHLQAFSLGEAIEAALKTVYAKYGSVVSAFEAPIHGKSYNHDRPLAKDIPDSTLVNHIETDK